MCALDGSIHGIKVIRSWLVNNCTLKYVLVFRVGPHAVDIWEVILEVILKQLLLN